MRIDLHLQRLKLCFPGFCDQILFLDPRLIHLMDQVIQLSCHLTEMHKQPVDLTDAAPLFSNIKGTLGH